MAECVHLSIYISISLATLSHKIPFHPKLHKDRSWLTVEQLETRQGNGTNATEAGLLTRNTGIDDLGSWSLARTVHITLPFTQESNGSHLAGMTSGFWIDGDGDDDVVIVYFSGWRWKEVAVVCVGWREMRKKENCTCATHTSGLPTCMVIVIVAIWRKQSVTTSCVTFSARLCLLLSALQCRPGGSRVDFLTKWWKLRSVRHLQESKQPLCKWKDFELKQS